MNPSEFTPRAISMAPIGRRVTQAPQRHYVAQPSGPRRTVLATRDNTAPIGAGYDIPVPRQGPIYRVQGDDSEIRRNGVYTDVVGGRAAKRARVNLGGSSAAELRAIRAEQFNNRAPVFNDTEPNVDVSVRGAIGLPTIGNLPQFRNPLPMTVDPSRTSGPERIIFAGMRESVPVPAVAHMIPDFDTSPAMAGTRGTGQFRNLNLGGQPRIGSGYDIASQFDFAAANIEKKTKSGSPNARITYTHTLNQVAAAYAAIAQEKMIWIVPIVFEEGMTINGLTGQMQEWGVDIQHAGHNLAVANYMLALSQLYPQSVAEVQTVDDVLEKFRYAGVVASEEGAELTAYAQRADANIHRNIVFTVMGEVDVYNYWGLVHYGQVVGIIVKGKPLKEIFAHHYINAGTYNLDGTEMGAVRSLDTTALSNNPIQFIPWHDAEGMGDYPDIGDLEYTDDYGVLRMGQFIRVGKVLQVFDEVANEAYISRAPYSVAATRKTNLLRIIVETNSAPQ